MLHLLQLEVQGAGVVERPLGAADVALSASCSLAIWTEDALQVQCTVPRGCRGSIPRQSCALQVPGATAFLACCRQPKGWIVLPQGSTMEDVILDVLGPALYTLSFAFSSLLLVVEATATFQVADAKACLTRFPFLDSLFFC